MSLFFSVLAITFRDLGDKMRPWNDRYSFFDTQSLLGVPHITFFASMYFPKKCLSKMTYSKMMYDMPKTWKIEIRAFWVYYWGLTPSIGGLDRPESESGVETDQKGPKRPNNQRYLTVLTNWWVGPWVPSQLERPFQLSWIKQPLWVQVYVQPRAILKK